MSSKSADDPRWADDKAQEENGLHQTTFQSFAFLQKTQGRGSESLAKHQPTPKTNHSRPALQCFFTMCIILLIPKVSTFPCPGQAMHWVIYGLYDVVESLGVSRTLPPRSSYLQHLPRSSSNFHRSFKLLLLVLLGRHEYGQDVQRKKLALGE
ncbi:hypothetical protein F4604DRAFT_1676816 [Suillus subluteus]|nr:hypothetical protein F4604DRAFT_1676816 [Suillus subluteus]